MRLILNNKTQKSTRPLFAVLLVGSAASTFAGPHHFQKWAEGEIVAVDVNAHSFAIHTSGSRADLLLKWDASTALFAQTVKKPVSSGQVRAGTLHRGEKVRVLYQRHGNNLIAERVLTELGGPQAAKN